MSQVKSLTSFPNAHTIQCTPMSQGILTYICHDQCMWSYFKDNLFVTSKYCDLILRIRLCHKQSERSNFKPFIYHKQGIIKECNLIIKGTHTEIYSTVTENTNRHLIWALHVNLFQRYLLVISKVCKLISCYMFHLQSDLS